MVLRLALLTLFAALLPSRTQAAESDLALIAIKPAHGVEPSLAQILGEALAVSLRNHGAFNTVLGTSDVTTMLDLEQQKGVLGCDETSCIADLGVALGVPYGGYATVGKLGSRFLITLKVIDIGSTTVVASAMIQGNDESDLVEKTEDLVAKVAKQFSKAHKAKAKAPSVAKTSGGSGRLIGGAIAGLGMIGSGLGVAVMVRGQSDFNKKDETGSVQPGDLDALKRKFTTGRGLVVAGVVVTGLGAWKALR